MTLPIACLDTRTQHGMGVHHHLQKLGKALRRTSQNRHAHQWLHALHPLCRWGSVGVGQPSDVCLAGAHPDGLFNALQQWHNAPVLPDASIRFGKSGRAAPAVTVYYAWGCFSDFRFPLTQAPRRSHHARRLTPLPSPSLSARSWRTSSAASACRTGSLVRGRSRVR